MIAVRARHTMVPAMINILLTGAAGHIGRTYYGAARGRYRFLLTDLVRPGFDIDAGDSFVQADLTAPDAAAPLVDNIDVIVHMAAESDETSTFDDLLEPNIVATTRLLDAAARSRVSRFVYASSLHAVHGYPDDRPVAEGLPVRPTNVYGATKCYGEALCRCYSETTGLSIVALRIGDFEEYGSEEIRDAFDCSAWISPRDIVQLIDCAIEAPDIGYFIAHGVSDNRCKRLDLTETRRVLGYEPQDDAFDCFDVWRD